VDNTYGQYVSVWKLEKKKEKGYLFGFFVNKIIYYILYNNISVYYSSSLTSRRPAWYLLGYLFGRPIYGPLKNFYREIIPKVIVFKYFECRPPES